MKLAEAKILFVDDEPSLLDIFGEWLSGGNAHGVATAADGLEALEMLEKDSYDLLITDVNMPRMNGTSLVRNIATKGRALPGIIFISGFGDVDEREMYGFGVEAFLSKPVMRNDLIRVAERALAPRSELWQTPLEPAPRQSIRIEANDICESALKGCVALGRGGFSVPYDNPIALGKVRFECFVVADGLTVSGEGYVRWRSKAEGIIGIEFAYLDKRCRAQTLEAIEHLHSVAFIPSSN